jgi:hypothetical protein
LLFKLHFFKKGHLRHLVGAIFSPMLNHFLRARMAPKHRILKL